MTKDEALQMCLEYIETDAHERKYVRHAIKKALAAPVQEPVAWQVNGSMVVREDWIERLQWPFDYVALGRAIPDSWVPVLYTTPPAAQRQFVGLSDEDYPEVRKDEPVILAAFKAGANWAEAKLKEKNT